MIRNFYLIIAFSLSLLCNYSIVSAHCDTMDGPVVGDAKKAIEKNNVNYVLKWVLPENEKEIKQAFKLTMKVREFGPDAEKLADQYFFETLVRLHRTGEGMSYTGIKPSGTPIDEKIIAADKSIEIGNLSPLESLVEKAVFPELKKRFEKLMALRNFDVNDVEAGREYIEAYVQFFHYAEGETEQSAHEHANKYDNVWQMIPWALSGLFLLISVLLGVLYFRNSHKRVG